MPEQLVGDQDLIGIAARESVGSQAPHLLEQTGLGCVAKSIQAGPVEASSGVAVIDIFMEHLVPKLGHLIAQRLQLGTNRAACFLRLRRNAGVNGDGHWTTSRNRSASRTTALSSAYASASASRRGSI